MRLLQDLQYTEFYNLKGGVLSWKAADRPLETD
jgi:rhodanese-related sulfurtransferase